MYNRNFSHINRRYFEDGTSTLNQYSNYTEGLSGGFSQEAAEEKINRIDSYIDEIIVSYFLDALRFGSSLKAEYQQITAHSRITYDDFLKIMSDAYFAKDSFLNYLHGQIKKHILNVFLVEATLIHDNETKAKGLDKTIKKEKTHTPREILRFSNVTKIYCDYLDTLDGTPRSDDSKSTREQYKDLIKELRRERRKAHSEYNTPSGTLDPDIFLHIPKSENQPYIDALYKFNVNYLHTFSLGKYVSRDLPFLAWANADFEQWLTPSFFPYYGTFFDMIVRKQRQNNLYYHCRKYLDHYFKESTKQRTGKKKHDFGRDYNFAVSAYYSIRDTISLLLKNLSKDPKTSTVEYATNKFLLNHFIHENFFGSLDSQTYGWLCSTCVIDSLIAKDNTYAITPMRKDGLFSYSLINLLSFFDVNMHELDQCNFFYKPSEEDAFDLSKVIDFTEVAENLYIPLNLIHAFLDNVYSDLGEILSNISLIYGYTELSLNDYLESHDEVFPCKKIMTTYQEKKQIETTNCYRSTILLKAFSEYVHRVSSSKEPLKISPNCLDCPFDNNQQVLNVLLLHSSAFSSILPLK